ncbi:MAG: acyl-CoA dehydrogenase [Desulfatitalea sp.]|nr:acyl-CoA dehydrogenase [Desulfatitalea sp.]NNK02538.1 acyl-CoA dehydrogenase [Desulfatitalea sp.]
MAKKFYSERNLKFLLYEAFDVNALTQYNYYEAHNRKSFDLVLKSAGKIARDLLWPIFEQMDREPPELRDGTIKVHADVRKILREFGGGGWISTIVPYDLDGEQLPLMIANACQFIFMAANYSAAAYPGLSDGAARLIESFGSKALYDRYVPKLREGIWQGTMALTEPEAGSSLSDITTTASPTGDGHYQIRGQKIFISAGDSDAVDNVVHLLLGKIDGAPAGVKGISLFVVPKKRVENDGTLTFNDVNTSGVYHKLGYRGCPIAQLSFGDNDACRGYLVGEPHHGLRYMFQMMNEARIGVGLGATAMATAAYYASLAYAKERKQGRKTGQKDPALPQVAIIEHADVKRMLFFQRAIVEGALALAMQCSKYVDMEKALNGHADTEPYGLLLDLLTPVLKTYPSEMGILSISQGLQCFGGSGFCDDYPLEQYYRDCRIHPIHEGTTAIHGMDLLGRKVVMNNGRAIRLYFDEVEKTITAARGYSNLIPYADPLKDAMSRLSGLTDHLHKVRLEKGDETYLADATLYLEYFGIICIAWQWLVQGVALQSALNDKCSAKDERFYNGKMTTLQFYYAYELPKINGLEIRLRQNDGLTVEASAALFDD